jgi:serine/threonine protein kinase, bacterial
VKKIILILVGAVCLFILPFCKKSDGVQQNSDTTRTIFTSNAGNPRAIALDKSDNLYATDPVLQKIFKVTKAGVVTVLAGTGEIGYKDGPAAEAMFEGPSGIAVDTHGNVYVSDLGSRKIRKIGTDGIVTSFADAVAYNICIDKDDNLLVADYDRNVIAKISSDGTESIIAGKAYYTGYVDGAAEEARFGQFGFLRGITTDAAGNIYVAEGQSRIRKIAASDHRVSTFTTGRQGEEELKTIYGISVDADGNFIVADNADNRLKKVSPDGVITTFPDVYFGVTDAKITSEGNIIVSLEQTGNIFLVKVK